MSEIKTGSVDISPTEFESGMVRLDIFDLVKSERDALSQEVIRHCKEIDRLREALGVTVEALGKCRDLPMPLFIDGVMVATEALARIEEIISK